MSIFKFIETDIPDLVVIEPKVFGDERGFFMETYSFKEFQSAGINAVFVQDNHSRSSKGVLRGLHFQVKHSQAKLVRVVRGRVFDVAVDLRKGSPTYGKWFGLELSDENKKMLFIPKGFAHGFLTLSDVVDFVYKVDDYYHPGDEGGILWSDPDIAIDWPLEGVEEVKLSDKDRSWLPFRDFETPFIYRGGKE